jgi:hypothetical protein
LEFFLMKFIKRPISGKNTKQLCFSVGERGEGISLVPDKVI